MTAMRECRRAGRALVLYNSSRTLVKNRSEWQEKRLAKIRFFTPSDSSETASSLLDLLDDLDKVGKE